MAQITRGILERVLYNESIALIKRFLSCNLYDLTLQVKHGLYELDDQSKNFCLLRKAILFQHEEIGQHLVNESGSKCHSPMPNDNQYPV